jgi:diamine N-acetyltransferase
MIVQSKNNKQVRLRKLISTDLDGLLHYLHHLSAETKSRFGPHPFNREAVIDFYNNPLHHGYVAEDAETNEIIAYAVIKTGYLEHDKPRLQSYHIEPNSKTDCTFAPSVADAWQGFGTGNSLFGFILSQLRAQGFARIILWGGVQAGNQHAVHYYQKNGFVTLGQFEYNGPNYDMICYIKK